MDGWMDGWMYLRPLLRLEHLAVLIREVLLVKNIQAVYWEVESGRRCFDPSIPPPGDASQTKREKKKRKK